MKKLTIKILKITSVLFLFACSSVDENVKVKNFHGFSPKMLKKHKTIYLPFILKSGSLKEKYNRAFVMAHKKYLPNQKASYPHQTVLMLEARGVFRQFVSAEKINPLTAPGPFVKIGKKTGYRYLVIFKFDKPLHIKVKRKHRKTVYVFDRENNVEMPQSVNVFININRWYQKGEVFIIDSKIGECVFYLSKKTKSGFSRESTRSYGPATVRDLIDSSRGESIPTLTNALVLFFRGVFGRWN